MNSKIIIAATVAALSLATTAFAGEGGRDTNLPYANVTTSFNNETLPENGQNGAVQTANSLPRGFENGTAAYMQAQSVNRWFAQQAEHRFAQTRQARPNG